MTRECIWVDEDQHRPVPRLFSRAEILPADDPVSFSADPSDASRLPPQKSPLQRKTTVGRSEENETYRTMINKDSFHDCYRNERQLQKGSFGIVYEATLVRRDKTTDGSQKEKKTNTKKVAVKVIDRLKLKQVDDHAVFREVRILHELADVPGVITLVDFFVEPKTLYVVQTLAAGGDVFERLTQRQHYTEEVARNLARTLLQTLAEIHNRKIVHRDLKPGNLLLADDSDDESILLADFGFATHLGPQGKRRTRCGTPHFVAPEVILDTPYTEAVDMWSCGCILYMLLSGCPPFQGDNLRTVFRNIRAGNFAFHNTNWSNVSIPAKQMIVHLLTVNPKHRWTASQALESSWMKMPTTDSNKLSDNDLSGVLQSIRSRRKLKAAMDAVRWAATAEFWSPKSIMMSDSMKTWDDLSDISITINVADHMTNNGILLSPGTPIKMIAFDDRYTLIRKVKKGPFASVWECCDNETQKMCAVKIIPRPSLTSGHDEEVLNEVSILESVSVDNPESIVQLIEFYEEEEVFYVVMELMNGGNVLDRLEKRSHYSECDARNLIRKLLQAVKILHENNIAHRDIKPENLLLEVSIESGTSRDRWVSTLFRLTLYFAFLQSQESDSDIKLCDFGFSRRVHTPESLTHRVGVSF